MYRGLCVGVSKATLQILHLAQVSDTGKTLCLWEQIIVKYTRNTFEQLDIRELLFCLITLANVIEDSKDFHPFECICSL